jgi:hypothetical protein
MKEHLQEIKIGGRPLTKNELKIKDLQDKINKLIKYIKEQKTFAKEAENEYAIQICNQTLKILGDDKNVK